jgi:acetolactate synthase regulatory subunit
MEDHLSSRLERKVGMPGLIEGLAHRLTTSELNSLLLKVYRQKATRIGPAELLAQYRNNRLVQPSPLDMIGLLELELQALRFMRERGFQAVELSPAAQFGSCSVVATVDQQKVITALRNTEIVADATNALALHIAATIRASGGDRTSVSRLCTVHRHIRTQPFPTGYLPHFKIGCMVSSGLDTGSYEFECDGLLQQLRILFGFLRDEMGLGALRLVLKQRGGYDGRNPLIQRVYEHLVRELPGEDIAREEGPADNSYYKGIQFKLYADAGGRVWEIADGGFVDWTQQLLGNRKERLLISGFGLEWLYKIRCGLS